MVCLVYLVSWFSELLESPESFESLEFLGYSPPLLDHPQHNVRDASGQLKRKQTQLVKVSLNRFDLSQLRLRQDFHVFFYRIKQAHLQGFGNKRMAN